MRSAFFRVSPSESDQHNLARERVGHYALVHPLGIGGMATVWLAVDTRNDREVAIKRPHPQFALDAELRREFLDEGMLGLRLKHPHIVETIGLGEDQSGEPFLILERLRGRSLGELARAATERGDRLPLNVALTIVRDIARGLHHAHQLLDGLGASVGVVHRDVSPHNVFVCEDGVSKILDFGIAQTRGRTQSDPGTIRGRASYLAPERILGREADARFDVFSLGVILHELITGVPLFRAESEGETLYRVLDLPVPPPELARVGLPPAVSALALRALQRDPDRRLPSGEALAETIEAVARVEGLRLDADEVRAHLSTLTAVVTVAPTPLALPRLRAAPPRRPVARFAFAMSVLAATAFAAVGVTQLAHRHEVASSSTTPSTVARPGMIATPTRELPGPTVGAPKTAAERQPNAKSKRRPPRSKRASGDCGVYFSITGGKTTVSCADADRRER